MSGAEDLGADAALAVELVRQAGSLAARMRSEGVTAEQKTSVSDVVTEADRAAERLIVDLLARERPEDAIVGEEGTDRPGSSDRSWVIDPVDGTYNFLRGFDWWCSAVGLVTQDEQGERILLGAVHHAASGRTYVGGPDLPSQVNGVPMDRLGEVGSGRGAVTTYLHPPFIQGEIGEAFARAASRVATVRMFGSGTMDAMAIAEGRCDALFQHTVPDWDRVPGAAIIRGVGGASRQVDAAGVRWHVAGVPSLVDEISTALP